LLPNVGSLDGRLAVDLALDGEHGTDAGYRFDGDRRLLSQARSKK